MSTSVHVVCPHCVTVNRVLSERLAEGRCGRCKHGLFTGYPIVIDDSNFDLHVRKSDVPVVVDFWAAWCGPCRMMAPHFERAAAEVEPEARLAKLDTERRRDLPLVTASAAFRRSSCFAEGKSWTANRARWITACWFAGSGARSGNR